MAADLNKNFFVGNLVKDSNLKDANGFSVLEFTIAVNESVKQGDSWNEYANFFDCVMYGKRAQSLAQYLTKGAKVAIDGHPHQDRWEKDGQKHSRIVFRVDNIELVGGKRDGGNSAPASSDSSGPEDFPSGIPF